MFAEGLQEFIKKSCWTDNYHKRTPDDRERIYKKLSQKQIVF